MRMDLRERSDDTGVGEQTHVSNEMTLPFGYLTATKGPCTVAGEQQQHDQARHTNTTAPPPEHNHLSAAPATPLMGNA